MYAIKLECPAKAARCMLENPSRVVSLALAPYFTKIFANGKFPSRQDCCKAVRPSGLYWLILTWVECIDKNLSTTWTSPPLTITDSNSFWWRFWVLFGCFFGLMIGHGNVVMGLKGWSISSYLLANRGNCRACCSFKSKLSESSLLDLLNDAF